jgi:hypothetical protein
MHLFCASKVVLQVALLRSSCGTNLRRNGFSSPLCICQLLTSASTAACNMCYVYSLPGLCTQMCPRSTHIVQFSCSCVPARVCNTPAGLCDAHVHVTATTANLAGLYSLPESLVTARAADILEGMISRGFTTVRDAGAQQRRVCRCKQTVSTVWRA